MLNKEQIEKNKNDFINEVCNIKRLSETELHNLLEWLDKSDFYSAPGSTKYHHAYEGGLCEHSLSVLDNLRKLYITFNFELPDNDVESIAIVALFHDLAKVNYYSTEIKHRKVYDNTGKSYWEDYTGYVIKDDKDRFMLGNHEENSAYLASMFLPLRMEEYSAILNHHGGLSWDSVKDGAYRIFERYPLAHFLHIADTIDAYHSGI